MDMSTIFALIAATAVLVSIPGPNVALFVANTLAYGPRHGAITVLGTTFGVAVQLAIVVMGFALVLEFAASALNWLRWGGVLYLLYLGYRSWRQGREEMQRVAPGPKSLRKVFWQGLMLAVINPKTLLFSAAFLPQFAHAGAGSSFVLLAPALIYLSVICVGDMCWVGSAQFARPLITRLGRWRHRLIGGLFFGSGIGLALARIDK
ncbi:LysE family translocator [uncultured Roseovarius sp.]|uniref:LysE family translocator n=1 Tax=uncultured Roseovarius sp. TaxID=293344 RepID=UPI00261B502E|nr:LysE family translocator [uncultured Roseovarius sp.]